MSVIGLPRSGKTSLVRALTAQAGLASSVDLYDNQEWRQTHPSLQRERSLWLMGAALRYEAQPRLRALLDQKRFVFVEGYTLGARLDSGLPPDWCAQVDSACRPPDVVLYLQVDPEVLLRRGAPLSLHALRALEDKYELESDKWLRLPGQHPHLVPLVKSLLNTDNKSKPV